MGIGDRFVSGMTSLSRSRRTSTIWMLKKRFESCSRRSRTLFVQRRVGECPVVVVVVGRRRRRPVEQRHPQRRRASQRRPRSRKLLPQQPSRRRLLLLLLLLRTDSRRSESSKPNRGPQPRRLNLQLRALLPYHHHPTTRRCPPPPRPPPPERLDILSSSSQARLLTFSHTSLNGGPLGKGGKIRLCRRE